MPSRFPVLFFHFVLDLMDRLSYKQGSHEIAYSHVSAQLTSLYGVPGERRRSRSSL